ncbi:PIF1 [Mytilus coruscus]|uniref:PIF1 n=1 Tax=Mytilus coruscus TaxID=42192 RepID=A0A6J8ECK7_MYTCO|nr:PIF1 [Mytilus coruscus]
MDSGQDLAKKLICNGHNLVLTGQGGTGKTYTIKSCFEQLTLLGKCVQLTCYTGIACRQYPSSIGATTLHRFCGLEDGRHNNNDLLNLISKSETSLSNAVSELEKGEPSEETNQFIKSLNRDIEIPDGEPVVKLFSRNLDVDFFNCDKLETLNEYPLHCFPSKDEGDHFYLKKMLAPKHLGLKISAPVMLLVNLSDKLVNGLIGRVQKIHEHEIQVQFVLDGKNESVAITQYTFTKYDPVDKKCIAKRIQFPIKLAFAITIHKSQGMTIPYLEIDCKNSNQPGQVGVAVGRAKSISGIKVTNYKSSNIKRHPEAVYQFYRLCEVPYMINFENVCCKIAFKEENITEVPINEENFTESDSDIEKTVETEEEEQDDMSIILEMGKNYIWRNLSMSKNKPELGQVLAEKLNEHSAMPNYCIFKDSSTCTEKEMHPDTIVEMPETEISVYPVQQLQCLIKV